MKKVLTLIACSFLLFQAKAQDTKVDLTPKTSVVFPGKAEKKSQEGSTANYLLVSKDTSSVFTAVVVDLEATRGQSEEMIALAVLDTTFWDQVEQGYMSSMGEGVKKLKREVRKINGKEALYMEVERQEPKGMVNIAAMVMIEGKYSINLVHIDRGGKDPARDRFFRSVAVQQ